MQQSEEDIQKQHWAEVDAALDHFVAGLKPFAEQELEKKYGLDWQDKVSRVPGRKQNLYDPSTLLGMMLAQWREVFANSLENTGKNLIGEIKGWRNYPAHRDPLSAEDVIRSLDSMSRLLELVAPLCQTENITLSLQKLKSRKLELEIQRLEHLISTPRGPVGPVEPPVEEKDAYQDGLPSDIPGEESDVPKSVGDLHVERVKKPNSTMWLLQIYDGDTFIGSYERSTTEAGAKEKEIEILWPNEPDKRNLAAVELRKAYAKNGEKPFIVRWTGSATGQDGKKGVKQIKDEEGGELLGEFPRCCFRK